MCLSFILLKVSDPLTTEGDYSSEGQYFEILRSSCILLMSFAAAKMQKHRNSRSCKPDQR